MKDNLQIYDSALQTADAIAKLLLQKAIAKQEKMEQLFVALSGGETPEILFELLANQYKKVIPWSIIRFYWVDERCVAPENKESNYGEVKSLLFNNIAITENQIERIIGENEPCEEALRYSSVLSSQLPSNNTVPCFDLVLLGVGNDGHTASIFPNQLHVINSNNLCEVAEHPDTGQKRITLTTKIINNAREIIFFVTGKNKSQIVLEILHKEAKFLQYPVAHISPTLGTLVWMIDKEAAQFL